MPPSVCASVLQSSSTNQLFLSEKNVVSKTSRFIVSASLLLAAGSCADGMSSLPRHCRGIEPNGPELTGINMARVPAPGFPTAAPSLR